MKGNWIKTLGLAVIAAAAAFGAAQDYQTMGGGNDRLGRNSGATLNSAGRGLLTWYAPLVNDVDGYTLIRDNLSTAVTRTGTWNAALANEEVAGSYITIPETPTIRADEPVGTAFWLGRPTREKINYFENQLRGLIWNGALPAPTGYSVPPQPTNLYSFTVPSAADPTVKQFGADTLSVHEWAVEPPADATIPNQRYPRNYALYAYINIGPTGDGLGGLLYPQRYYVYEIIYDGTKRYVDIVDTYAGGTAWVRLGNGGYPTEKLFTYNGVDPIRIRLLNTVPRKTGHTNDSIPTPYPLNDPRWLNTYPDQPYSSIVYADAVKAVPATGEYTATPIVTALNPAVVSPISVFDARNEYLVGTVNGDSTTTKRGIVRRRDYNTGTEVWKFDPLTDSTLTTVQDNNSAGVTFAPPWAVSTFAPGYRGTNYLKAPITTTPGTEQSVMYTPTLVNGTYEVQVWMPGSRGGEVLGTQVVYLVHEGATTTTVTVDQSVQGSWVRLGNRRFSHDATLAPLRVEVTNLSTNGADLGREALADAVQFIGAANLAITSTPVHAVANVITTNGGTPALTPVIIVAAEDGKLYCLDATGNGDGTTNIYWTYPSTKDKDNASWTDPNAVATEDGGIAQMPTGFDLSTALIQTIGGADYLFVASKNGRIYAIEMAGRGDMDLTRRVPGTTRRVWTYPNDFPAQAQKSTLGSFQGSLTYGVTAAGPTIFVGAPQGRLYALEAMPATVTNKTTNVRWVYPALNAPTLGAIRSTPVFFNNRVYFGTDIAANDDRGRFFCMNADTGAPVWEFNGSTIWGGGTFVNADGFISSPATATSLQLGGTDPDMIYVANDNRWISGLDAATGAVLWTTDELNSPVLAPLTVAEMNVFDNIGGRSIAPLVMVPTADGRFRGLFAKSGAGFPSVNINGRKLAWGYNPVGAPLYAAMSSGRSFIYGADQAGIIYGFNDLGNGLGQDIDGPGTIEIVENDLSDPDVTDFKNAKLIFVTKDTYQRLRLPANDPNRLTYAQALDPTRAVARPAFDWGETVYALAYDFPYINTYTQGTLAGTPAPPPYVNFQIGVEGSAIRNLTLEAQQFRLPATAPLATSGTRRLDGYACLAYIIQSGGSNSMPPGSGRASFTISTTALKDPPQAISITPTAAGAVRIFIIANPLGLIMVPGDPMRQIGNNTDPSDPENAYNGNRDDATTAKRENLLFTTPGILSPGNAGTTIIGVVDRSLMTLLRGPGRGLDNVRFSRGDLAWQGGKGQVLKRIDSIPYYAAFWGTGQGIEDYPEFFPNISLDYPDIMREQISVVSDINFAAENPIFGASSLRPPTNIDESVNPPSRVNNPTPYDITLSVLRFQPPNLNNGNIDSAGASVTAGYYGNMAVFVDSNGDGQLSRAGGRREAFRSFWLGSGVAVDERFLIETPTVDLGSLASGTGYDPADPTTGTTYSPWGGAFQPLFKPFVIRNIGNVNLLNLRVAKYYANGTVNPWEVFSTSGHELSWLDASRNLHSTLDPLFALIPGGNQLILQKPRVGDANGTTYKDNPNLRDNANLGTVAGLLLPAAPNPANPVIAMSIPLGWPVGAYQAMIRVIEDAGSDLTLAVGANNEPLEGMSEPGMLVKAQVHETQATTTSSAYVAPNIDDLAVGNENYFWMNNQPAAMRTSAGHLVTSFVSDRFVGTVGTAFDKTLPTAPLADNPTRLYFSSVQGTTPGAAAGSSPLRDLNAFLPQPPRWWRRDVADYPTQAPATLFPGGDPIVAGTPRYFSPSMPMFGDRNPITGATHPATYVAFVGSVQKQAPNERYGDNRIFIAPVTVAADGSVTVGTPVGLPNDTMMQKARPSVLQIDDDAVVFFTAYGTGQTAIHYATYNGTNWGQTRVFSVGNGFEMVGSPNISARVYEGFGGTGLPNTGARMLEISFTGKRRGRPANEIFMGRMALNGITPGDQYYFQVRTREILRADGEAGTYSASGVDWNTRANTPVLEYQQGTNLPVNIEVPNTRTVDSTTGVISFDTTLGGKAFLDPSLGTVRLTNSLPARNSALLLTYQPKFLRISTANTGYANSTMMFDNRLVGELSYWATPTNVAATLADPVRAGRYLFTYSRAAAGTGQAPRPYVHTLRAGITLPRAVATTQSGNVNVTVNGLAAVPNAFYQVDPANGRIYFTANMENRPVTVTYTSVDDSGTVSTQGPDNYTVTLLTERTEAPVFMNQAVNESQLASFIDPFETTGPLRRPGLIWLFWTSTRGGTPDVFFQTLAPRFTPSPTNN